MNGDYSFPPLLTWTSHPPSGEYHPHPHTALRQHQMAPFWHQSLGFLCCQSWVGLCSMILDEWVNTVLVCTNKSHDLLDICFFYLLISTWIHSPLAVPCATSLPPHQLITPDKNVSADFHHCVFNLHSLVSIHTSTTHHLILWHQYFPSTQIPTIKLSMWWPLRIGTPSLTIIDIVLHFSRCSQRWSVMRIMFLLLPQSQLTPRDCQFWTAWSQLVLFLLLTKFDWVSHDHNCCLLYFLPTLLLNSWSLYTWDISTVQIVDLIQILRSPKLMSYQFTVLLVGRCKSKYYYFC
jgi:hypothetical protein